MFELKLFNVKKQVNDTYAPDEATGTVFQCEMKSSSSILFPIVDIHTDDNNRTIPLYNYAYIDEFKRYYWIDDIIYDIGVWTITMHCDALASFRSYILNSYQYVARSALVYDDRIMDTAYLVKSASAFGEVHGESYRGISGDSNKVYVTANGTTTAKNFFNVGITSGTFVIGIVGNNTTGVTYYSMSNTDFKNFISNALTFTPSDMSDVSSGVANAVFNPIQYVTSVKWYPISPYYSSTTTSINVGAYTIPGTYTAGVLTTGILSRVDFTIPVPKHDSGIAYMNLSPYAEYNLRLEPFGVIPLDTTKLLNSNNATIEIIIDFCSGMCTLYVGPESDPDSPDIRSIIYSVSTEYGVNLPISSLVMDWKAGAVVSALQFLKPYVDNTSTTYQRNIQPSSTHESAGSSNTPSIIPKRTSLPERTVSSSTSNVDLLNSAIDLTASALGQISTSGAVGSFLAYQTGYTPRIEAWWKDSTDRQVAIFGAPLYRLMKISELKGFCLCINTQFPNLDGIALEEEIITIENVFNTGVFIS